MILSPQTLTGRRVGWLLSIFTLVMLAWQCNPPPDPALPTPVTGPVARIALLAPTSGEMATFGRILSNGSRMALDQWNNQGGLLGHQLEWMIYDTGCQFETARRATRQALDDGLELIIGPLCSEAAIAAAELAEAEQALMISPTATHPLVTVNDRGQTRATIFRAAFTYSWQGQAAARFAYETLKVDKAALLVATGDDYATGLTEAFAKQFTAQGGEIVYRASYAADEADFKQMLLAISASSAGLIYLPAPAAVVNRIAGQLKELGLARTALAAGSGMILLGSDSWESPELDLTTTAGSYFTTHFVLVDQPPSGRSWAEAYKAIYAVEPNTLAALGYDATGMLLAAIQQAGTFEPAIVAKTLEQGTFDGITGQITFDGRHNPIKPVPLVQIKAGGLHFFTSSLPP